MQRIFREEGDLRVLEPIAGKNSEALLVGTPVTIDANGFIAGATSSGEKIYGFCIEDKTMASDNQTVAKYKPQIVDPSHIIWACNASASLAQTDLGEYGDISSNTSGVIVMANPSTSGQFILIGIDADDDTLGYWRVAEPQVLAFAQA